MYTRTCPGPRSVFRLFRGCNNGSCWLLRCTFLIKRAVVCAKDRAVIDVGLGIVTQPHPGYFDVRQLGLYRVRNAYLEGQRFAFCYFGSIEDLVCFITRSIEPLPLWVFYFRIGSTGFSQPGECKELKCAVMFTFLAQHFVRNHTG